jgi:hypothetical protein
MYPAETWCMVWRGHLIRSPDKLHNQKVARSFEYEPEMTTGMSVD